MEVPSKREFYKKPLIFRNWVDLQAIPSGGCYTNFDTIPFLESFLKDLNPDLSFSSGPIFSNGVVPVDCLMQATTIVAMVSIADDTVNNIYWIARRKTGTR